MYSRQKLMDFQILRDLRGMWLAQEKVLRHQIHHDLAFLCSHAICAKLVQKYVKYKIIILE